jgi:biotin transporter BioY
MTAGKQRGKAYREIAALTAGTLVIYVTGVPWLAVTLHLSFNKALLAGLLPFSSRGHNENRRRLRYRLPFRADLA